MALVQFATDFQINRNQFKCFKIASTSSATNYFHSVQSNSNLMTKKQKHYKQNKIKHKQIAIKWSLAYRRHFNWNSICQIRKFSVNCCWINSSRGISLIKAARRRGRQEWRGEGGNVLWTRCFAYQSENQLELAWHAPLAQLFSLKLSASLSLSRSLCLSVSLSLSLLEGGTYGSQLEPECKNFYAENTKMYNYGRLRRACPAKSLSPSFSSPLSS